MSTQDRELSSTFPTLDFPELTDHSIFDEFFVTGLKAGIAAEREQFLRAWDESVELERQFVEKCKSAHTRTATAELRTQFQALRSESYRKTRNSLFAYVYKLYENELANPSVGNVAITPERVAESTRALHGYIAGLNGDSTLLDRLIQELGTLQSKNQEFIFKVFVTLHGELLNKQLKQSQTIVDLRTEIEKNTESYLRHLDTSATSNNQLLQAEQDKTAQLLSELNSRDELNTQLSAENLALKRKLEQSDAGNQTLIEDGEKETDELRDQIKTLENKLSISTDKFNDLQSQLTSYGITLEDREASVSRLRDDKANLETKLEEANELVANLRELVADLEEQGRELFRVKASAHLTELNLEKASSQVAELQEKCDEFESEYNQLRSTHNATCATLNDVRRELEEVSVAKNLSVPPNWVINEKTRGLQSEEAVDSGEYYDTYDLRQPLVSSATPTVEGEDARALAYTVANLNLQLQAAQERSSQLDRVIANHKSELQITQQNESRYRESFEKEEAKNRDLIGELRSNNRITEELRELIRFCEQNHADNSPCENRAQFYRIEALEKENEELRSTMPFDLSRFGAQAGTSAEADQTNLPANVTLKDLETSLVKGLGELFTREDKKNIRVFRGKPSDPPITSWLKDAEITAYLNGWDDEQKVRYFSDRLKDEAAEWLREYVENDGDVEYGVWKDALISRFRNQADIEQLKHCLQNLKQGPEQRTQSFIAKINSLFDDIYGPVKKPKGNTSSMSCDDAEDDNQTDALHKDIKRMRDDAKQKILIRGLLPKIRNELWPRITDEDSFEDICKAALTAESVVIKKELNEEKTLVVASVESAQLKEKETELTQKQSMIDMLKEQNDMLKLIHSKNDSQGQATQAATVGAVGNQNPQSGSVKTGNKNVQFKDTPPKQGTGQPYNSSRNASAERHPKATNKQNNQPGQQIPGIHPFGPYLNQYPAYWVPQQSYQTQHGFGYPFAPNQIAQTNSNFPQQIPSQQFQGPPQPFQVQRPQGPPPNTWGIAPTPPPPSHWGYPQGNWTSQPPQNSQPQQSDQSQPATFNRPDRRDVVCHICGKKGHYARGCWDNPANQQPKQ